MSGTIHSDQLKDLKIFDLAKLPLQLCRPHQELLRDAIATDIHNLVQSRFFQNKFSSLFPSDRTGAHFNIRLTDHSIVVQLLREDESSRRLKPEGQALAIDFNPTDDRSIAKINKKVLDRADTIYQECQKDHFCSHRTASGSLRDRASNLTLLSDDELLDDFGARHEPGSYEPIDNLATTLHSSLEPCKKAPVGDSADPLRSGQQTQLDLEPHSQPSSRPAPSPNLPHLNNEQFEILTFLAQQLAHPSVRDNENLPSSTNTQLLDFPEEIRDSIYFQMYSICNPSQVPDTWKCGEKFFQNQENLHVTNSLRALAITRCQLQLLANEFAELDNEQTPSSELIARFSQLSEENQTEVFRQYQFLHRQSNEPIDITRGLFLGLNGSIATNKERTEAISRCLQAQISEHYGKMISKLTNELNILSEQLDATQVSYREDLGQFQREMISLRAQSRLDLTNALLQASRTQTDLDILKDEVNAKDSLITELQRELQSKKQELREQFETLIDTSDRSAQALKADIAELKNLKEESIQHSQAEQRWEKERLRLENAIEAVREERRLDLANALLQASRIQTDLDILKDEVNAKDSLITELQRELQSKKQELREQFETLIDTSDRSAQALKAHIAELKNLKEEESIQHSQAEQRWEKEHLRLENAIEAVREERRLADIENTGLRQDLENALGKLDAQVEENQKLSLDFKKQVKIFESKIEGLAEDLHHIGEQEGLNQHAKNFEEPLSLLCANHLAASSHTATDLSNPITATIDEGREVARQLEEIVRAINAEPIIFCRLEQSLVDGYTLNRQLSQVEEMSFDKSSNVLKIDITEALSKELKLPRVFTLNPVANELSLGKEFILPKKPAERQAEYHRICRLMLIKRLQMIQRELITSVKRANESRTTPWRTWGEVFGNFTTFSKDLNLKLPTLRQDIANYKEGLGQLLVQGIDEAVLKQCIAARKIPAEIPKSQSKEIGGLIRLYQTMAKSCEEIFLHSLPRKIPMHHAWKILMLTRYGLPDRAYQGGHLKAAEAQVVEPLQKLIPEFYRSFSSMLQSIQISNSQTLSKL